jgi:hypothetical protein
MICIPNLSKKSWKLSKYEKLPGAPVLETIPSEEKLKHDKEIENHTKL